MVQGFTDLQTELMITLPVFLCTEIFVLTVGYLDKIMEHIQNESKCIQTRSGSTDLKSLLKAAKNDIIIIGSTLSSLDPIKRELKDLSSAIKVELYITSLDYMKSNTELHKIPNYRDVHHFENRYNFFIENVLPYLKSRENTDCFSLKFVWGTTYIAIDIDTQSTSSQILVEQYTLGDDYDVAFLIKPGCELYDIHRNQIELIKNLDKIEL